MEDIDDTIIKCTLKSNKFINRQYACTCHKLGKGSYSKVYKGYIINNPEIEGANRKYIAIKKMKLDQLKAHDCLENEIDIMRNLDHPNILKLIDVIEETNE